MSRKKRRSCKKSFPRYPRFDRSWISNRWNPVQDYLGFLKSGSSVYPLDVLKKAGVDLTTPKAVKETFAVMESYIDRLEELVG